VEKPGGPGGVGLAREKMDRASRQLGLIQEVNRKSAKTEFQIFYSSL
jgi:hypothetical protein